MDDIDQALLAAEQAIANAANPNFGGVNPQEVAKEVAPLLQPLVVQTVQQAMARSPLSIVQGPQGEQGPAGRDGKDGKPGRDGKDGQDGKPGKAGAKIIEKHLRYPDTRYNEASGSSLVGFIQSGSGATSETVQDILRSLAVTPQMFGAAADGVTDDSTALQAALDTGRPVLLTDSTYLHATALTISRTGACTIIGQGATKSKLKYTGSGKALSLKTDVDNVIRFPVMVGFQIDCTASTATHGLHLDNAASTGNGFSWGHFEDLYVFGASTASSFGVRIEGGVYSTFKNVVSRAWDTGFHGGIVGIPTSNITMDQCKAVDCTTYGFYRAPTTSQFKFDKCNVEGDSTYGYYIDGFASGTQPDSDVFIGSTCEDDHSGADFYFNNCRGITVIGGAAGTNTTGDGMVLVNTRQSVIKGYKAGINDGGGKYAIKWDSNSQNNEIFAYVRDADNLSAVSIGSTRNTYKFNFQSNGTSPLMLGGGTARNKYSTTGGTIDPRDDGEYFADSSGGNITLTMGSVTAQNEGCLYIVHKTTSDANLVTITGTGGQTIGGRTNYRLRSQYQTVILRADFTIPGYRVVSETYPGTFGVTADVGDAAATLTPGSQRQTQVWNTTLTAARAVTLSTTDAWHGCRFRIIRTTSAAGDFLLNVGTGPLVALAAGEWCDVVYDGSAWMLEAHFPYGGKRRVGADVGDAAKTLTVGVSEQTQVWNTALGADRAVTLNTGAARSGDEFHIVRTAASTGVSNLNVGTGPLKALAAGTWCVVKFNGSAWYLDKYGAL